MTTRPVTPRSPVVAFALSFLIVGLGHLYLGRVGRGVAFFLVAAVAFVAVPIVGGVLVWLVAMVDAARSADRSRVAGTERVIDAEFLRAKFGE